MHQHLAYLRSLLYHKWLVLVEGRKLGVPLFQLLVHDWSKFLPDEWRAGVAFRRYGEVSGSVLQKHYSRNRHHPQYWVRDGDILPMPEAFCLEMLADWKAVGRSKGSDTLQWYSSYGCKLPFHQDTRAWVEKKLGIAPDLVVPPT